LKGGVPTAPPAPDGRSSKRIAVALVVICLLALLARLFVLQIVLHREAPVYRYQDSLGYLSTAESLLGGKGYVDSQGRAAFWWPPGYPGFIATVFAAGLASPESLEGILVIQAILSTLTVGAVFLLALYLEGFAAAVVAGSLMILEPSCLAYSNMILSEAVFSFLLLMAALAWRRWWIAPGLGSLLAFSAVVAVLPFLRPLALYLWIPLACLIAFCGPANCRRLRAAALFVIVVIVPIAAWDVRNYSYLRTSEFATVGQFNEARFARAVEDLAGVPRPEGVVEQPWEMGFGPDQGLSFVELVRLRHAYFRRTLLHHPLAALQRLTMTGIGILGVPDGRLAAMILPAVPEHEGGSILGRVRRIGRMGWLGGLLLLGMLVSVAGFLSIPLLGLRSRKWPRDQQVLLLLLVLLVFYQLLIASFIMFQGERFRVPVIPLLAVLLGGAVAGLPRTPPLRRELTRRL
jgi:4-amino-4-deoxy-L-arabinose transferase-like glycosyltransferase